MTGLFITFEGIEGCGKSTQIELFSKYLESKGHKIVFTREPGGTSIGDQIREVLLNPKNTEMAPVTELLLYAASRTQHVAEKIVPALKEEKTVLCDRYADATTAYQGAARNLPEDLLKQIHHIGTSNLDPDITFLLDLPAKTGLDRARSRNLEEGSEDRFENEELHFHERVRSGYLKIAKEEPNRVIVIDATGTIEEIQKNILGKFEEFITKK